MSNQDIYRNGKSLTFYCEEQKKWIVCVERNNIKLEVVLTKDTFEEAKHCIDNGGAV